MAGPSSTKRCKCCEEVMDELLTMRQTFEKLRKEIIGLRRDVYEVLEKTTETKNISQPTKVSQMTLESTRHKEPDFYEEPLHTSDFCFSDTDNENAKKKTTKKKRNVKKVKSDETNCMGTVRPVLDFFNIQARVMPTQPFRDPQQFEDWNILLRNDEDQRDQLRVELMQGNYTEPEKYIRQTWRSIFHNDAGYQFSYRNTGRDKRAIKDYIFTDIFKEIFLQRFYNMDAEFFIERTMRFFKYVRDQKRKAVVKERSGLGKDMDMQIVEEPLIDE